MVAILNSAILNLAIFDSAILVFPLKLTHTCQDWFPPFAQKNLHSFILTQLDNGSHLEFYCCWIKKTSLIHSDWSWWWQPSWILPSQNLAILDSAILVFPLKLNHTCQDWFPPFAQKSTFTHSFWLNLMMAAILNSGHVGFRHCHLSDSDTFLSSLRLHSKTLSLHSDSWLKLIQSDSN